MEIIDIEILENFLDKNERKFVNPKKYQFLVALEKLIQAYKQDVKVINEMAEAIYNDDGSWNMHNKYNVEEIIKYFRKKCE